MKKWIDFIEVKLHSNENIEWHWMQLELIEVSELYDGDYLVQFEECLVAKSSRWHMPIEIRYLKQNMWVDEIGWWL